MQNLPAIINESEIMPQISSYLVPDRFMLAVNNCLPTLKNCSEQSIKEAVVFCAVNGLLPGKHYGQCYILPFKNTATFVAGYRGLVLIAKRAGVFKDLNAGIIKSMDKFKFGFKDGKPVFEFEENILEYENKDNVPIGVWVHALLPDGTFKADKFMKPYIEKCKNVSPSKEKTVWKNWPDQQWIKTGIKRFTTMMPIDYTESSESQTLQNVIAKDNEDINLQYADERLLRQDLSAHTQTFDPYKKQITLLRLYEEEKTEKDFSVWKVDILKTADGFQKLIDKHIELNGEDV